MKRPISAQSTRPSARGGQGNVVTLRNGEQNTGVHRIAVETIACLDQPGIRWDAPASSDNPRQRDALDPGESWRCLFSFTDAQGRPVWSSQWSYTFAFTDALGQRWRRVDSGKPERIDG